MKPIMVWMLVLFGAVNVVAAQEVEPWVVDLHEAHRLKDMPYRLMKPLDFDPQKRDPVIVSLHGGGGTGTDNVKQLRKWNQFLAEEGNRKDYPCYVLAPQTTQLWNASDLSNIKEIVAGLPAVDVDRIYILGHSMGGHGTYVLTQLDPGYFAAAAPSAGSGLPKTEDFVDVSVIKDIPFWIFHGDQDPKCPIEKDQKIFAAMKTVGGNMKFTTWKGDKHGGPVALKMLTGSDNGTTEPSSDRCDPEPVFLKWLFSQKRNAGRNPNILLILADDMGYSDLGCMGGDIETPHLDALAKNGILFPNFYNNAKCAPSRASLMTGQGNHRTGAFHGAGDVTQGGMTIAEALKGKYTNLMIDKWHLKPEPLELGFERYFGSPLSPVFWWPTEEKTAAKMQLDGRSYTEADIKEPIEEWYLTIKDTDYAIQFLEEEVVGKDKPFFMYYASHAPHWPLQAPRADVERYLETYKDGSDVARRRRYDRMAERGIIDPETSKLGSLNEKTPTWDALSEEEQDNYRLGLAIHSAMVYRMDQELGRLFDFLKEKDLFDNTVIFFLSDNGASAEGNPTIIPPGRKMGDRGTHSRLNSLGASVCNTPMRGHKSSLYEGSVGTPMIFHWPDGIGTPGKVSQQVGHLWDIFPTALELAGVEYPSEYDGRKLHPLDGESLMAHIRTGEESERTICWDYENFSALRKGKWKALRRSRNKETKDGVWQLYDLSEDRTEMNDVASAHPETVETLVKTWNDWQQDVGGLHKPKG